MLKNEKYFILCILILATILSTSCANLQGKGEKGNSKIKNGEIENKRTLSEKNSPKFKFDNYQCDNLEKDDIKFFFEGKPVELKLSVYNDRNRFYIPLYDIISAINGNVTYKDDLINFTFNNKTITLNNKEKKYHSSDNPDMNFNLKKDIVDIDGNTYISIIDLTNMLDLKTRWSIEKKEIYLFCNKERTVPISKNQTSSKYALIRLEDITAGQRYENAEELEKLRVIGDYLYSQGVPFHIAWVPRYINKFKNIDNDPSKTYNMYNADFVFTMDYLIKENGLIGLHGYTHQFRDEISIDGNEFSRRYNTDEKSIRDRLQLAINVAKDLNFDYAFFESPHYAATESQHKIMEDYFDYIYEANVRRSNNIVKGENNKTIYVPTPLNYVDGKEDLNNMLRKIEKLKNDKIGSFFYHPNIEFEFIKFNGSGEEYPSYEYDPKSVLHQIIDALHRDNYKFISIRDLH